METSWKQGGKGTSERQHSENRFLKSQECFQFRGTRALSVPISLPWIYNRQEWYRILLCSPPIFPKDYFRSERTGCLFGWFVGVFLSSVTAGKSNLYMGWKKLGRKLLCPYTSFHKQHITRLHHPQSMYPQLHYSETGNCWNPKLEMQNQGRGTLLWIFLCNSLCCNRDIKQSLLSSLLYAHHSAVFFPARASLHYMANWTAFKISKDWLTDDIFILNLLFDKGEKKRKNKKQK